MEGQAQAWGALARLNPTVVIARGSPELGMDHFSRRVGRGWMGARQPEIGCCLRSPITSPHPGSPCHLHLLETVGLIPTTQDRQAARSCFLCPCGSACHTEHLWGEQSFRPAAEHGVSALSRLVGTSGCPRPNRSPAPWCVMRRLCSQPRLWVDGTKANWEHPGPALALVSELEDFSRGRLDVTSTKTKNLPLRKTA